MENEQQQARYDRLTRVARLLHRSRGRLMAALGKTVAPLGVSLAEYAVMSALSSGNSDTAAEIGREICYSPAAMTRLLDRLERKRMVRRLPHPTSRRAHMLELTEEGGKLFFELRATFAESIERFMAHFDSAELIRLEVLLDRIQADA